MVDIRERMDQLEHGEGACPLCGTPLSEDRCRGVLDDYRMRGEALKEQYRGNEAESKRLQAAQRALQQQTLTAQALQQKQRAALQTRVGSRQTLVRQAEEAQAALPEAEAQGAALTRALEERTFAREEQRALEAVIERIAALGYDAGAHEEARRAYDRLRPADQRFRDLEAARSRLPEERGRLAETVQELEERRREQAEDRAREGVLAGAAAGLDDLRLKGGQWPHAGYIEMRLFRNQTIWGLAAEQG